ncbi:hypothetical protein ABZS79_12645 [Streptomyces griseoloalbus]
MVAGPAIRAERSHDVPGGLRRVREGAVHLEGRPARTVPGTPV